MTRRVAAVDCGTNSIRLLVADVGEDGLLTDVVRRMEVVRLGQGIDRTGVIAPEAMERTLTAAAGYAATCRELGAQRVRFVATSASRDARNADDFVAGVREAFGDLDVAPEVVAGEVEARLSFTGATGDLRRLGVPGPYLVVDLGGGSTELVRGTDDVEAGRSVDIGCVRMTERHLAGDPPSAEQAEAARHDVRAALDLAEEAVDLRGLAAVVGLAGSITTVTAHALGLGGYDRDAIHLAEVPLATHRASCAELLSMPREQRAALPYMHPGRVDVIGAGALVWDEVLGRVADRSPGVRVVTSEHDILDGIALSVADA
ncbi:Ppx/GppA phosphatase family protein [Arthrobacter sp. NEB 688]|uniref:Ppx/GppA phosphatase family protein n=1 Tax=Arthrobacter sp. NEB 688 TaxID=904039 RepID=UPI00156577BC|nr:Ppx/GppA phosphatase family protein [Arthrobacter sp. NEB 688]QKE85784.1 Ppx/GppA family phosphatase [Arthrobacter sp. NEB 688]